MKWLCLLGLVLPLSASEIEGTVWYDSAGEVALVEGPAAEPAKVPFVPEWRKREIERRERMGYRPIGRTWYGYRGAGYRYGYRSFRSYSYRSCGWSVRPVRRSSGSFRGCFGGFGGSRASVIIRR